MKRCNSCQREYEAALNFCSYDGSRLASTYDPEATAILTTPLTHAMTYSSTISKHESDVIGLRAPCPHCKIITPQRLHYFYEHPGRNRDEDNGGERVDLLFICGTCDRLLLYLAHDWTPYWKLHEIENSRKFGMSWDDPIRLKAYQQVIDREYKKGRLEWNGLRLIWPIIGDWAYDPAVPPAVRKCYFQANKNYDTPNVFLSLIRKALEAICDDKDIGGGTLQERLEKLTSKYQLPPHLVIAINEIRRLGNVGAHNVTSSLNSDVVWTVGELFRLFVEYLYEVPDRVCHLRYSLEKVGDTHEDLNP